MADIKDDVKVFMKINWRYLTFGQLQDMRDRELEDKHKIIRLPVDEVKTKQISLLCVDEAPESIMGIPLLKYSLPKKEVEHIVVRSTDPKKPTWGLPIPDYTNHVQKPKPPLGKLRQLELGYGNEGLLSFKPDWALTPEQKHERMCKITHPLMSVTVRLSGRLCNYTKEAIGKFNRMIDHGRAMGLNVEVEA